jgi:Heavy-metal resistance protein CzcE
MKLTFFVPVTIVIASALNACATRTPLADLYGQSASAAAAERTIVITPATKYVNVVGGQIVKFVAGDKEFAWNFNNASTVSSFGLNEVAPAGALDHPVRAYISPDPKYMGGGDRAGHGSMR